MTKIQNGLESYCSVTATMTKAERSALKQIAEDQNITVSAMVAQAIREHFNLSEIAPTEIKYF